MGRKATELSVCRECGAAVADERAHKRWHDRVVTTTAKPTGPRFIGEPADDEG